MTPILFNSVLERIVGLLQQVWRQKGFGIDMGSSQGNLTNLRFADDLLLIGGFVLIRTNHAAHTEFEGTLDLRGYEGKLGIHKAEGRLFEGSSTVASASLAFLWRFRSSEQAQLALGRQSISCLPLLHSLASPFKFSLGGNLHV